MTEEQPLFFKKIAIIGVGLIGGSLGLVLRERGLAGTVTGIGRTRANLELALERGIIDDYTLDIAEGVSGAGLIVVCVPVRKIGDVVRKALPGIQAPCIITDVGSVKVPVIQEVEALLPKGVEFVPAHPVAGTEESGAGAAFETLFEGRLTVVTPTRRTERGALAAVEQLWREAGSSVVTMEPAEHDRVFSLVSHLPHVIAYALVNTVACERAVNGKRAVDFSAGGFRDFTRIASSSPEMWRDICAMNREHLLDAIGEFESRLSAMRELIAGCDFEALQERFEKAKKVRDSLK